MILGVDVGTATIGWAVSHECTPVITELGAQELDRSRGEGLVESLLRRNHTQMASIQKVLARGHVRVVVAETLVLSSKGVSATAAVSLCWGALEMLCAMLSLPLYRVHPTQWQRAISRQGYEVVASKVRRVLARHAPDSLAELEAMRPRVQQHAIDAGAISMIAATRPWLLTPVIEAPVIDVLAPHPDPLFLRRVKGQPG